MLGYSAQSMAINARKTPDRYLDASQQKQRKDLRCRAVAALLTFIFIASLALPAIAYAATVTKLVKPVNGTVIGIVTGSHLNVRNGPSTANAIIAKLQNGDVINITGYTSDGWLEMNTSTIALGYVTAQYVNVPVVSVTMTAAAKTIAVGSAASATGYTIFPACATNKAVTWTSSNTAVATVSTTGAVTAKAPGKTTITVKTSDGAKTATCVYTITQPVTGVSLNKTTSTINVGATEQLTATVAPANASNKAVTWSSSNTAVATVSSTGLVTGKSAGTVTITVKTANGAKTATCTYTVTAIAVTGITLNKTTSTLTIGATEQLTATVTPNNATNRAVTWTSSNPAVATVSSTGLVTAKAAGTATITVTTADGAKTATCVYTVSTATIAVAAVTLSKTTSNLTVGATEQLTAAISPANATNKAVTWASNNTGVATVSSTGLVTAKAAGTATITVTTADGAMTATCVYTVSSATVAVTGIKLNKTTSTLTVGATEQLTATITPSNATNKAVTWTSSNTAVAVVSSTGLVTAKSAGTTTIAVKTSDGAKTATCTYTVKAAASTLAITGATPITQSIMAGKPLTTAGTVKSNYPITSVVATIKSGSTVKYTFTIKPNATSYIFGSGGAIDTAMAFSDLPAGTYTYTLTATDSSGMTKTFTSTITVMAPSSFTLTGSMSIPNPLPLGTAITVQGKIHSGYTLVGVDIAILKSTGVAAYRYDANPASCDFDTHKADAAMKFNAHPIGTYRYVITAKDRLGVTKVLRDTTFVVSASSSGGSSSNNLYVSNSWLTKSQMTINAQYILDYLRARGWTKNAVCGMLGNMQTESSINPGIWQGCITGNMSGGYGLVQWTPATKYINWANSKGLPYANMDSQLQRILWEVQNGQQFYSTSAYPMNFASFTRSTASAYYLGCAFLHNYERPKNASQDSTRGGNATYWYNTLQ